MSKLYFLTEGCGRSHCASSKENVPQQSQGPETRVIKTRYNESNGPGLFAGYYWQSFNCTKSHARLLLIGFPFIKIRDYM